MKKVMKNKMSIAMLCCLFTINVNATVEDSIQSLDALDVHLDRGVDTLNKVNLVIQNLLDDSINIYSNFYIDEYYKASRIWIYSCKYSIEKDSLVCDWGYSQDDLNPYILKVSEEKGTDIPPKGKISLEIPLHKDYDKSEIYLDVRILYQINNVDETQNVSKITNRVYFEWTMSKLEKRQMEQIQKWKEEENN